MANLTHSIQASIVGGDGSKLVRSLTAIPSNGRRVFDDVVPAGTIDVGAFVALIESPQALLIVAEDPSGFTVDLDGLGPTTMKMKTFFLELTGTDPIVAEITTTVTGRVQIFAVGDPA